MSQYQSRGRGNFRRNTNYQNRGRGRNNYNYKSNYNNRNNFRQGRQSNANEDQSDDTSESTTNTNNDSDETNSSNGTNSNDDYSTGDNDTDKGGYNEEEEEEEDEYQKLKKGDLLDQHHQAAPSKSYRSLDHTPAQSMVNPEYKVKEVHPFIDAFIKYYNENSTYLPEFYTQDAAFSLTFKKVPRDSVVAVLFEDNRNLFYHQRKQPVLGGNAILTFLQSKFRKGSNLTEKSRKIQFVSDLFFAVNIYGTMDIYKDENDMLTVNFAKTLVVIGKNGKLLITNDHLAICV